jgi:glycosyltransferase involved in cell wall biosynthesis
MHGREDMGVSTIIPRGFRTIVATLLNWFHSWYLPHPIKIKKDDYLADTTAKAKMWTMMVNHANYADYVITPSHHFAKKLTHYGVKHKIQIFPNGYPDQNFPTNPTVKSLNPSEPLKIIWHSRLSGEKRIIPFLQALSQVNGKYHLDVYGGGADLKRAKHYVAKHKPEYQQPP